MNTRHGWQRPRVDAIREARCRVVRIARHATSCGVRQREVASWIGRSSRTLRRWGERFRRGRPLSKAIGRKALRSELKQRQELLASMREFGPELAVGRYQALHRAMPRREVRDLVRRYRTVCRKRQGRTICRLTWTQPGFVWAVDHSHVPATTTQRKAPAIACRDLASHFQLRWEACREDAIATAERLSASMEEHGAPLVLKADNGPAFRSKRLKQLLDAYGVELLPSPPSWPQYNGSCEAANLSLKRRTRAVAQQRGSGSWSNEDLELALQQTNHTARPWGVAGPPPIDVWRQRRLAQKSERAAFRELCARLRGQIARERALTPDQIENEFVARAVQRAAVSRALIEHGLLLVRRRVIRPPIRTTKSVIVS